ncbi:hypothetical protein [Streptomyces fagopyri]|uniref:hypothetical protein n=1 Tax=Streptomyces fagopyri TaxID=2662397 RepID=UPI00372031B1
MTEAVGVPRIGPHRPAHVLGDKGHSSGATRNLLRRRDVAHPVPERADQVRNRVPRGSRDVRPPAFDKELCRVVPGGVAPRRGR